MIDGDEALALGLVTRVVDGRHRSSGASASSPRPSPRNAPLTIRATKEALRRIQAHQRLDPSAIEDLIAMCYLSEDFKGAVPAFLDKKPLCSADASVFEHVEELTAEHAEAAEAFLFGEFCELGG